MKKWLAILLALVMVLSMFMLTACGEKAEEKEEEKQEEKNDETPNPSEGTPGNQDPGDADKAPTASTYDTVEAAAEKTGTLEAVDVTIKGAMNVAVSGETMSYAADCNLKADASGVLGGTAKLNVMGQEMAIEAYYAGGYVYLVANGEKGKMALDLSELEAELENSLGSANIDTEALPDFDLKAFLNKFSITKGSNGKSLVKIAVELKDVQDAVDALMAEIIKQTTADGAPKITVKKFETALVLYEGYLAGIELKVEVEVDADGQVGTIGVDADIALNNPGQAVTITPPAGYESFPTMGGASEDMGATNESFEADFSDEL